MPPPPQLRGLYYLHAPDPRVIFLHNDLSCNDTCSVNGGSITYWGGGGDKRKRSKMSVGVMDSEYDLEFTTGTFSDLEVNFKLQRTLLYYVLQTYAPAVLIVGLSWVGFWVDPKVHKDLRLTSKVEIEIAYNICSAIVPH